MPPLSLLPHATRLPSIFMATMAWLLVKIRVKPVAVGSPVPPATSVPQEVMLPSTFMAAKA